MTQEIRHFLCNTNRINDRESARDPRFHENLMYHRDAAMAWQRFKHPSHMERVRVGDIVLMHGLGDGFVGIGVATGRVEHDEDADEWAVPCQWLAWDTSRPHRYWPRPDLKVPPRATFWELPRKEPWASVIEDAYRHFEVKATFKKVRDTAAPPQVASSRGRGGGESDLHERLKVHVCVNAAELLQINVDNSVTEYMFPSGDEVDVHVESRQYREWHVVEVKTDYSEEMYRGVFQAVKYRVLKCAELGLALGDPAVVAHLVVIGDAPQRVQHLARKYGVLVHSISRDDIPEEEE